MSAFHRMSSRHAPCAAAAVRAEADAIRANNATYGPPPFAAAQGVRTNRLRARRHARKILRVVEALRR